ncbi:hypothetical protein [Lysinibacillus contaminans]|uniref:hypothetical protein n=1 Tax=Lysinibacillus contaminans TaxID=1293441 RepID=UPI000A3EF2CE|nr:hypothetical protein [Lysinibacillus contaminans]
MVETVEEARQPVVKVDNSSYIGAKATMYGIEATLPKDSGGTSDPVYAEVQRQVYALNYRIKEYEQKIVEVQKRIPCVIGDREVEVLHRLLDGDSMRAIGKHMKLSSTTIILTRDCIVKQMLMGRSAPFYSMLFSNVGIIFRNFK